MPAAVDILYLRLYVLQFYSRKECIRCVHDTPRGLEFMLKTHRGDGPHRRYSNNASGNVIIVLLIDNGSPEM